MRASQGIVWGFALAVLMADGGSAQAAWNNVFQVCCASCRSAAPAPAVSGYGDACPQPQPQTSCSTRYVQRSYYQPVTSYRTSTYYEPVTTYRTSYYSEPVTTYRYSCYYDPCTCSYQQVAQPCTSYRMRSRCCPVTSYLQRTCTTPVTTYQQACYYEPVTTCCTTTTGAPVAGMPPGGSTAPPPYTTPSPAPAPAPVPPAEMPTDGGTSPAPSTEPSHTPGTPESRKYYNPRSAPPTMPPADSSAFRQPTLRPVAPTTPTVPLRPTPAPRPDRIASLSRHNVEGQVISEERTPRSGVRVLLVSADRSGDRQTVTADDAGQFRARVSPGGWLVYLHDATGRPVFARRVEVEDNRPRQVTLVER